ncbi:hypothetical protein Tco_0474684, partial [Tanacetum coccineum]
VLDNVRYVLELRRNLISLGTLEKEGFTVKMRSGKIKMSTQQCMKSGVTKHLGVAEIQQQNGLVEETNVTLLAKVVLYRHIGFNESGEYKKTFIGSGIGTGSVQVLQGIEFEVEPQEDHTFEVEQTQDLIYYHSACDREQHSAWELFSYREDSNEAAFAVAIVDKIYAHKLLTFNDTVASTVAGKAVTTAMTITGSMHQSRFYNGKLVQTLLEGHSILSLEGSLSGDCDVEKNDIRVFVDFDYTMGRSITVMGRSYTAGYMTLTEAAKEAIWLKGLAIGVRIRAKDSSGYCYRCLVKGYPWSEVLA